MGDAVEIMGMVTIYFTASPSNLESAMWTSGLRRSRKMEAAAQDALNGEEWTVIAYTLQRQRQGSP